MHDGVLMVCAGQYSFSYTLRTIVHGQRLELKRGLNRREYTDLLLQKVRNAVTLACVCRRVQSSAHSSYMRFAVV